MKISWLNKGLSLYCLSMAGIYANQASADWYSNDPELNRKQGFGDFPPTTIDQDLGRSQLNTRSLPATHEPQQYRDSNPWDSGAAPVDYTPRQYYGSQDNGQPPSAGNESQLQPDTSPLENVTQPPPYSAPGYGTYNPGLSGPWNQQGSSFQGPWNNTGSSFSPWSGRGGSGNRSNPFGMSGPGSWFD